jgi:hypothetical protein
VAKLNAADGHGGLVNRENMVAYPRAQDILPLSIYAKYRTRIFSDIGHIVGSALNLCCKVQYWHLVAFKRSDETTQYGEDGTRLLNPAVRLDI